MIDRYWSLYFDEGIKLHCRIQGEAWSELVKTLRGIIQSNMEKSGFSK